ncbi:MFS transporter [Novosphingobium sp. RD2P27]|uniref:MFS transporter n=1 Tax=Novosphingobium kalidii TaxID=3230299 RepID=A0ABV2D2A8_9SPHN
MRYLSEFKINWKSLMATFIGIGTGSAIGHYTLSLFGPELIAEFGWSKADYALIGSLQIFTLLFTPFAGRFTDRFGVKVAASIGFISMSLGFLAYSIMSGSIAQFFLIWVVQHIFGVLSTSLVFSRLIVEQFDRARGSALALLMTSPPLIGAIMAPITASVINSAGWRTAFVMLAVISAVGGVICVTFMARTKKVGETAADGSAVLDVKLTRPEFMALIKTPTFLLLVGGMALINVPQVFASSQLKLIVLDAGVTDEIATWMVSLYALGVIGGRILFGVALDRVRPDFVALFALSLPAIGYLLLASSVTATWLLMGAVLLIGFAQGAEGDIGGYLISRHFSLKNYSLILGFVKAGLDGGGAIGALILSFTLRATGSYTPFLVTVAVTTVLGAVCFFLTGPGRNHRTPADPIATEAI